jgi:hypothetical protein
MVPVKIKDDNKVGSSWENKSEILYPGNPVKVDISKEIEMLIMSEDFTYDRINKMEYISA